MNTQGGDDAPTMQVQLGVVAERGSSSFNLFSEQRKF
jgi:hypothetical protein